MTDGPEPDAVRSIDDPRQQPVATTAGGTTMSSAPPTTVADPPWSNTRWAWCADALRELVSASAPPEAGAAAARQAMSMLQRLGPGRPMGGMQDDSALADWWATPGGLRAQLWVRVATEASTGQPAVPLVGALVYAAEQQGLRRFAALVRRDLCRMLATSIRMAAPTRMAASTRTTAPMRMAATRGADGDRLPALIELATAALVASARQAQPDPKRSEAITAIWSEQGDVDTADTSDALFQAGVAEAAVVVEVDHRFDLHVLVPTAMDERGWVYADDVTIDQECVITPFAQLTWYARR